ncbi:MAG: leucine-rich repeat domain-containing protein, partial [Bacilli bacterium]|nr:leucine-rich repeat domain-containing protein [Bacilli bacterium]
NFKLDGGYNVKDGRLNGLDILVSGTKPTNGTLIYENNVLKDGCLAIDGYKITIEDGEVTDTTKGTCEDVSLTSCTSPYFHPSPVEWFKFNESDPTMLIGFQEKDDEHPNGWDGETEITIPCKNPDGQDITSISNGAFRYDNITSVIVPDTVTLISNDAFSGNPIKNLMLGQNVEEISNSAFNMSGMPEGAFSLKTLVLPDSLKSIKNGTFQYCAIENIIFEGDIDIITSGAFMRSPIKNVVFNGSVEEISYGAFQYNLIENVVFNGSVGTITNSSFEGHKMRSVILPEGLESFGNGSFASEYLEEITFPKNTGDIVGFGYLFSYPNVAYPNLKTIYNNTGKAYDWNAIIGNTSSEPFITGTVTRSDGSIVNILESN